ncbi:16S rRNA (cytidine(1402)-2'-O)-methyltransferase [Idiomarina seosinensis]|uniref:16S rRNA (cytidine(1402)-2'-O)-methyltransferase n=1 Tax=Idiomarina seosinensis TaxID=281739 RepID=UPI00384D4927
MSAGNEVKEAKKKGTLFIVPTPIGNLGDITERAIEVLAQVDAIAAEDTRHSGPLMQHLGIKTPLITLHEHNESQKTAVLIEQLQQGKSLALISDAGTPLISDPGYTLVRQCRQAQLPVVALPGPCAITTALSAAGLATDRFTFEGFLPAKPQQRRKQLSELATETRTMVFYESPHRILHTLADLSTHLDSEREIVLARELTKQFETYLSGTAAQLLEKLTADRNQQRGEMVIIVAGQRKEKVAADILPEAQKAMTLLCQELPLKKAAAICAGLYDERKNALYQWALENLNK